MAMAMAMVTGMGMGMGMGIGMGMGMTENTQPRSMPKALSLDLTLKAGNAALHGRILELVVTVHLLVFLAHTDTVRPFFSERSDTTDAGPNDTLL